MFDEEVVFPTRVLRWNDQPVVINDEGSEQSETPPLPPMEVSEDGDEDSCSDMPGLIPVDQADEEDFVKVEKAD
jgi:hypothetical protein